MYSPIKLLLIGHTRLYGNRFKLSERCQYNSSGWLGGLCYLFLQVTCVFWPYLCLILNVPLLFGDRLLLGPPDFMTWWVWQTKLTVGSSIHVVDVLQSDTPSLLGLRNVFHKKKFVVLCCWVTAFLWNLSHLDCDSLTGVFHKFHMMSTVDSTG